MFPRSLVISPYLSLFPPSLSSFPFGELRPVEMFTPGLFEPNLHLSPVGLWLFATGLVISPGFWLFPPDFWLFLLSLCLFLHGLWLFPTGMFISP